LGVIIEGYFEHTPIVGLQLVQLSLGNSIRAILVLPSSTWAIQKDWKALMRGFLLIISLTSHFSKW